jgi:hypothetical protein
MNSDILLITIHVSSVLAFIPIAIMLWNLKQLKQRTFGWAILGYFATLFLAGILNYGSALLFASIYRVFHVTILFRSYFIFLLFYREYTDIKFKKLTYLFLILTLSSEILEFTLKGGFLSDNNFTFPIFNLVIIMQYFLYLVDALKNRPTIINDPKGSFLIVSITYFYAISQLFFAFVREDIRFLLAKNPIAILIWSLFVWCYIIYLLISSYFLWKNLRR